MVQGKYQYRPKHPFSPGSEVAGVVSALGEGCADAGWAVGDRVMAQLGVGGFAECVHVKAASPGLARLPASMPFREAAGFWMI